MSKRDGDMAKIKNNRQKRQTTTDHTVAEVQLPENRKDEQSNFGKLFSAGGRGWLIAGIVALVALGTLGAGLKYLETDAKRQAASGQSKNAAPQEQSLLNAVNPFIANPPPAATPQLSKEYIYAGGKMLAVEDANANAAPPADLAVWRPATGYWYVLGGQGSQQTSVQWGQNGDETVPGDYDGDGKTDFSVFRQSSGSWYIQNSSNPGTTTAYQFGASGDKVAPADYDGDGRTDAAVFRQTGGNGFWYIQRSSDNGLTAAQFGLASDTPAPADYDGDGKADLAVWRPSNQTFYILKSNDGLLLIIQVGTSSGDTPVSADYDGDGRADAAVRSGSNWLIVNSSNGSNAQPTSISWQQAGDKAVQNDYDGDGKVDIAVWRESGGTWYIRKSSDTSTRTEQWGTAGDIPVPAFYRR